MKLRQKPDDFIVEEIPLHDWKTQGKHAVYKVSKVGMTTFAAEKALAKHCAVKFNKIGFAGLKDAHARTAQYFSVETDQPSCGAFKEQNVASELVGYLDEPLKTGDLKGNRFLITVRDLKQNDVERAKRNLEQVKKGVPNYYDSQRFGSLKGAEGFIAKDVLNGDYESAVKKIITATTRHQKAVIRKTRKYIAANWGKWKECLEEIRKNKLDRTAEGTMVAILAKDPTAFKEAFRKTFSGIRQIFFSAYQSYIWNECMKHIVRQNSKEVFSVEYEAGKHVFPRKWNPDASLKTFPLVAGDLHAPPEQMKIIDHMLKQEDMQPTDFFTEEHVFVARERDILVVPDSLEVSFSDDELNAHKQKSVLGFSLPKGAYATIITKALFEQ